MAALAPGRIRSNWRRCTGDTDAGGDDFDERHLPEITFSTALACAMCISDQIWPPTGEGKGGVEEAGLGRALVTAPLGRRRR